MNKAALLIGLLSVALAGVANTQLSVTPVNTSFAAETPCSDTVQKPKGNELTEPFQQTYPLSANGRVGISNINGDVRINVWDRNEVKVDAVKSAYDPQGLSEVTIDVVNTADSVLVKTNYPERQGDRNRKSGWANVEYTLTVPRHARVDGVELVNGSLDIEGVAGDVRISLVNGQARATGLAGEVRIATVNGGVEASMASLSDAKDITLTSVNGPIVLVVPSGANAQVKANTVHGAITNDFGLQVNEGQHVGRDLAGQIGSGGPRVRLTNVNGSISIKRGSAL